MEVGFGFDWKRELGWVRMKEAGCEGGDVERRKEMWRKERRE